MIAAKAALGGGGGIYFWVFPDFWYFFGDPSPQRSRPRSQDNGEEMNFFEGVYSFLFGDGNPNADLEERRWQLIGQVIRNNGGAVTAEQIAPYLDLDTDPGDDEWYMLPVLTHFNGRPEVTETGQIIYRFPELQTTAQTRKDQRQTLPPLLEERLWRFSRRPLGKLWWPLAWAVSISSVP